MLEDVILIKTPLKGHMFIIINLAPTSNPLISNYYLTAYEFIFNTCEFVTFSLMHSNNYINGSVVDIIYIMSCQVMSYHIVSYQFVSYHIISYHIISYHIMSYHIISYHVMSYHIIPYHIISYHIISYHITSYHIISYHIISYHIISHHTISYHIISYHIISFRYIISRQWYYKFFLNYIYAACLNFKDTESHDYQTVSWHFSLCSCTL